MKLSIREIAIFSMLGALMVASKLAMDLLPNIHLIGVFICAITVVYRKKALYPIYVFVFLEGLLNGFGLWWIPYLYIWTLLWLAVMIIPKRVSAKARPLVLMVLCSVHGFLYGTLYAPAQALLFGLNFRQTVAWIIAGLPYDCIHGISNLVCGTLILPIAKAICLADKQSTISL